MAYRGSTDAERLRQSNFDLRRNLDAKHGELRKAEDTLKIRNAELAECRAKLAAQKALAARYKKALDCANLSVARKLPYMYLVYVGFFWIVSGLFVMRYLLDIDKDVDLANDAYYATSVTVHGVGYGDMAPESALAIILCDMLAVLGFFMPIVISHFLRRIALWFGQSFITVRWRVISATGMILVTLLSGVIGIYSFELEALRRSLSERQRLSASLSYPSVWADFLLIFHLAVMTMTTTGYGDFSFHTTHGRLFAAFWIPFCTTSYSVAMTYLVELILGI